MRVFQLIASSKNIKLTKGKPVCIMFVNNPYFSKKEEFNVLEINNQVNKIV